MADRTLRFGIAGLGTAQADILPQMAAHPHIRVTAAADVRQDALGRFASEYGGEIYQSVEEMCRSKNVDAVYVSTPNHLHAEHVIAAAECSKQVIVEKPMALSLEQADAMVEAVERNGVRLLAGHTRSFDAPIRKMAEIVHSGTLGKVIMINTWYHTDWLYRPRMADELDPARGGGVLFRQGPHQVDIVRTLAGGLAHSVRASTTRLDPARPVEGSYLAFVSFDGGAAATIVFNGYGHFDSHELTWRLGEAGEEAAEDRHAKAHQQMQRFQRPEDEWELKNSLRYGGARAGQWGSVGHQRPPATTQHQPFFGLTVVSCEGGDIRQSPDGLLVYTKEGRREVPVPREDNARWHELNRLYQAWRDDKPLEANDGRWGRATLEVCLGILESSKTNTEVPMRRQVPYKA
jgi:phthalate 4,5-cis-dihydrodiol dehydrogenase